MVKRSVSLGNCIYACYQIDFEGRRRGVHIDYKRFGFGVKPSSHQQKPLQSGGDAPANPIAPGRCDSQLRLPKTCEKVGSKTASPPLPGSRWISTGYGDEMEPFCSLVWPPAKQTPQCAALQSRPTALRPEASHRALRAVQSIGLEKGVSDLNAVSFTRPKLRFPSLPILSSSMLVVFSFIKNLLIISAAWNWVAAWN